ncbi:AI-2E family transporter [Mangrovivirga sp. M17]|uniref:AI-2E family transporter n=1 Tax=Mangrovivirga halotolerans TaxID=2993936 RepID=A0ABT3RRR5_9BACT|nr:AI-2E family transporter [Mangrovivirga halotolerans]MCX2743962.1 AI-2E family transporter [Mangrovivirga halotolerans]
MNSKLSIRNIFFGLGTLIIIIFCLSTARNILIPVTWALLFSFLLIPLVNYLESKKFNRALAIIIAELLFFIVVLAVFGVLTMEVVNITKDLPEISDKFTKSVNDINDFIGDIPYITPDQFDLVTFIKSKLDSIFKWLSTKLTSVGNTLVDLGLMPIFIYFFLYYREIPSRFVNRKYSDDKYSEIIVIFGKIKEMINDYLRGLIWLTIALAILDYIILVILGIEYALFFAVFIAVMNLLPYIGNFIAMLIVVGFTFVTNDSTLTLFLVIGLLWLSNMAQENIFRPWLVGSSTSINALAILMSVLVGAMIWGVSGMILFVPIIGVLKIIFEAIPELSPYSVFLEDKPGSKD